MSSSKPFDQATDIPDLAGKVILVTGGTGGLGAQTVLTLAAHNPSRIFFTGRSAPRAESLISTFKDSNPDSKTQLTFLQCDLESFKSVKETVGEFLRAVQQGRSEARLDLLFCNAGIMAVPAGLTEDGYEIQFGVNHMAHALLIKLLLPTLLRTAKNGGDVRVILTTSEGFSMASTIPFPLLRTPNTALIMGSWIRYGQSKLANILYARQRAAHYPSIKPASIHPGIINTGILGGLSWASRMLVNVTTMGWQVGVEEGARNGFWAGCAPGEEVKSGGFYLPVGKVGGTTKASRDERLAEELWEWTQKELQGWEL